MGECGATDFKTRFLLACNHSFTNPPSTPALITGVSSASTPPVLPGP